MYKSKALYLGSRKPVVKMSVCQVRTTNGRLVRGIMPRLEDGTLDESNSFQYKLREVLDTWHIPYVEHESPVLDKWTALLTEVSPVQAVFVERILCKYYDVAFA